MLGDLAVVLSEKSRKFSPVRGGIVKPGVQTPGEIQPR